MKQAVIRVISCIIPLVMICLCIHKLNFILRPTDTDGAFEQIDTFHNLPPESLDIIVYGSSLAYRGIDSNVLSTECGATVYNYGYHWQWINTTKLFIQDSLLTQSPKLAIIESRFADRVLEDTEINPQIYYVRYLNVTNEREKFLKRCFGNRLDRYLSYYVPVIAFHDNWSTLSSKSFLPLVPGQSTHLDSMGSATDDEQFTPVVIPDQNSMPQQELPEVALKELVEIVDLCHNNGVEVLFYSAPCADVNVYVAALEQFAQQKDCKYINLYECVEEMGLDQETDFYDDFHVNKSGAAKISTFMGKYICENYADICK